MSEVNFVESSRFVDVPLALKPKSMTGGSGVLYGIIIQHITRAKRLNALTIGVLYV